MERKSYYLIILLVALVVCAGVFFYQFNNDVATVMIINETEVPENGSFAGILMDAYSYSDFTFAGNGKYQGCTYEGNVSVTK